MERHYEFTGKTKWFYDKKLYRIRATKDLPLHEVKQGELGGWIEKYENLADNAWVGDEAKVFGNARVFENAIVYEDANVFGNARVFGNADISGNVLVRDKAKVYEDALVFENTRVFDSAEIYGNALVSGNSEIYGNAKVYDTAVIFGSAEIYGNAKVFNNVDIGEALIAGEAQIKDNNDYCVFSCFGSRNRMTTFFKTTTEEISVICGCFSANLEEFKKKVIETHGNNKFAKEYLAMIELVKIKFEINDIT